MTVIVTLFGSNNFRGDSTQEYQYIQGVSRHPLRIRLIGPTYLVFDTIPTMGSQENCTYHSLITATTIFQNLTNDYKYKPKIDYHYMYFDQL